MEELPKHVQLVAQRLGGTSAAAAGTGSVGGSSNHAALTEATIKALLLEFTQKKRALEVQLRNTSGAVLAEANTSLRQMRTSTHTAQSLRQRFASIDTLSTQSKEMMKDFPYDLNRVRVNLLETKQLLSRMLEVEEECSAIERLLHDEQHFLDAHRRLTLLTEMRDQAYRDVEKLRTEEERSQQQQQQQQRASSLLNVSATVEDGPFRLPDSVRGVSGTLSEPPKQSGTTADSSASTASASLNDPFVVLYDSTSNQASPYSQSTLLTERFSYADTVRGLERHFKRVGVAEAKFEERLQSYMRITFDLARKRPKLLKQVLKVIETEERKDRARQSQAKGYHMMFLETLRQSLEKRFRAIFSRILRDPSGGGGGGGGGGGEAAAASGAGPEEGVASVLHTVEAIFDNLDIVRQVAKYFPARYAMFDFYVGEIHKNLRASLSQLSEVPSLSSGDIVNLYYWSNTSYAEKLREIGLSPSHYPISDTLRNSMEPYRKYLRGLMDSWSERLLERDMVEPEYVELKNTIMTDSVVTLFKFIGQQIDLISNTNDSYFIYHVNKECISVVFEFQKTEMRLLKERWKELPFKYVLALMNNNSRGYDYTEAYEFKVRNLLREPELTKFEKDIEREPLGDGFEVVRKECVQSVVNHFFDLFEQNNIFAQLFTRSWYLANLRAIGEETTMEPDMDFPPLQSITDTLQDVFSANLSRFLNSKFISDVAKEAFDRLLIRYVEELTTLKTPSNSLTVRCMRLDIELMEKLFQQFIQGRSYLARRLKLVHSITKFLTTPMDDEQQFIMTYSALVDDYPDMHSDIIKRIISGRADCDKQILNDIINVCSDISSTNKSYKPFFSRIQLQSVTTIQRSNAGLLVSSDGADNAGGAEVPT